MTKNKHPSPPRVAFLPSAALLAVAAFFAGCATVPPPADSSSAAATTPPPAVTAPAPAAAEPAIAVHTPAPTPAPDSAAVVPAPVPIDPLRPDQRVDPADELARRDLWDRIRRGFAMPDLDTELVRNREEYYASRPDYVLRMTERASRYLYHITDEVEKRGMPTELALLPFIESAFNPQALSTAKASGMWQFIPSTGKDYALTQNMFRDDRRDVLASTRAALDYLQKLHGMFGDWHLALAAYNWGEGSVQRAMARNGRLGLGTDYLSLNMPTETRYYVPKLQAVKNIVARPGEFSIALPPIENHPYFLTVPIERDIDVELAARLAEIPLDEFKALNPQMNRPVILAAGTPQVLLPYDNANAFVRGFQRHKGPYANWTAWRAPRTMRTAEAADLVGMDEGTLREINRIPARMMVRAGSTLLVTRDHRAQHADVSGEIADNATMQLAPEAPAQRRVVVKVGKGGATAAGIASRYRGVTASQVADWNSVGTGTRFSAGASVVVYLPARRAAAPVRTARPAKASKPAVAARKPANASKTASRPSSSGRVAEARGTPGG